ncbi:single-stranded DNA-binding protein, mitochondrial [Nasonia vitripennis]|uniref:Single-stranded DNA-binding protein, mitochondrial n=1 Tax=Nasonia vitripennis TaxID=7425 RepID=A0A7M7GHE6_NASVI|nr:single-stranded DNA-binding protein, mitochondrial [Nasonia vitripennis]
MMLNKIFVNTCKQIRGINYVSARAFTANDSNKIEKSLNQVTLLGRVGGEPQKRGNEEHPVVTFSLATHINYKYEGGDLMQKTDWHRIAVFKPNLRENVYNYMRKGQRVMVNGRLSYGEVKDEDGNMRTATSIIADDIIFFQ